jgi:transcriptional regulator with XRE-family HTH domain
MAGQDPRAILRGVGRRIAEVRRRRRFTQAQLAECLEVSLKYWQRVEAGTQNLSLLSLARIAGVLHVSARDLLDPPRSRAVRRGRPPT